MLGKMNHIIYFLVHNVIIITIVQNFGITFKNMFKMYFVDIVRLHEEKML